VRRAVRLVPVLLAWAVLRTPGWAVLQMLGWAVSLALQETSVVVRTRVQVGLRVLQAARVFLTSVHLLADQLAATLMLPPRRRLLRRLSVQSAPVLKVRATLAPVLVVKSLESWVTESRLARALLERVTPELGARPELALLEMLELVATLEPALLEMLELADLLMPVWEDRPERALRAMLDLELLETPVWEALQV
jgi:hypothetical protein